MSRNVPRVIARLATILGLLFASIVLAGDAVALDPDRTIRQFHHTAWTGRDGVPVGVWAIAQAPDGYLWLGTAFGLYRFDGIRFDRFEPKDGEAFLGLNMTAVGVTSEGDIWVGYQNGGASRVRQGRITNFAPSPGGFGTSSVSRFTRDPTGALWALAYTSLTRFDGREWRTVGETWGLPGGPWRTMALARDGAIWAGGDTGIFYLPKGETRFKPWGPPLATWARIVRGPDGRVWLWDSTRPTAATALPDSGGNHESEIRVGSRIIIDRDGSIWWSSRGAGVKRAKLDANRAGSTSEARSTSDFTMRDGLTSDVAVCMFEDREGNIWTCTNLGLDRFRSAKIVSATEIPAMSPSGYRAARSADGTLYVVADNALFAIRRNEPAKALYRLPEQPTTFLLNADDGALWAGAGEILRLGRTKPDRPAHPLNGETWTAAQGPNGALWVSLDRKGIYALDARGWSQVSLGQLPPDPPRLMQRDDRGCLWLSYARGPLALVDGNDVRLFGEHDGPNIGTIQVAYPTADGTLFGGEYGLALFDGTSFHRIGSDRLPVVTLVSGIVQASGDTWINAQSGIARFKTADLEAAFRDAARTPAYELLDFLDGLRGAAQQDSYQNTAFAGPDDRLWFITGHGVVWLDPGKPYRNPLPPPVVVNALVADGRRFEFPDRVTLSPGASRVEIDYAGLSLTAAERVRYRYKLEGADPAWVDPGSRRQAFYTNLAPGDYSFRVIASNNDGVWNNTGATLAFTIPPTFLQTRWFFLLCLLAGAGVLWLLYSLRLRQLTARLRGRLEERLAERERIARELHDTLLQGFQGLMLRFQSVAERIPADQPARRFMEEALDRADQVLVEGRDRVRNLRAGGDGDLAQAFARAAADAMRDPAVQFRVVEEGSPIDLHPIVRDEVVKIGTEAILNALAHAHAKTIDVAIAYQAHRFSLSVRDDGIGIDSELLEKGRQGHFGLTGMRERARKIHGELALLSRPGAGTEVDLIVPARVAYAAKGQGRFWWTWPSFFESNHDR